MVARALRSDILHHITGHWSASLPKSVLWPSRSRTSSGTGTNTTTRHRKKEAWDRAEKLTLRRRDAANGPAASAGKRPRNHRSRRRKQQPLRRASALADSSWQCYPLVHAGMDAITISLAGGGHCSGATPGTRNSMRTLTATHPQHPARNAARPPVSTLPGCKKWPAMRCAQAPSRSPA